MNRKLKEINKLLEALKEKGDDLNTTVFTKLGIKQATFYALRKKLLMLKRLDSKYQVRNDAPVTKEEYEKAPYPYGKRRKRRSPGIWMEKGVGKTVRTLLDAPLELPVQETPDTITLTYKEFARIVLTVAKEGAK